MKPWHHRSLDPLLPVLLLLLLLLLHQPHLLVAQTNLTRGSGYSSLKPPAYITSSSGDFAFGFRALDSNPGQYLLAVWFHIVGASAAEQTVVWFAKQSGLTVIATEQSVFSLTSAGQLSLADAGGDNLWTNPDTNNQMYGSVLALQDSGNLQFLDQGGRVVWESFQYPSDTLLPGQFMRSRTNIFSKLTDTDFSAGRFGLYVQADGNIVLYLMNLPGGNVDLQNAYWATSTYRPGLSQDGNTTLFFDKPGHLYYLLVNGTFGDLTPALPDSTASHYQRATLDPDGVVRVWIRPRSTTTAMSNAWFVAGQFPSDGCVSRTVSQLEGLCGPNSYCMYTDERLNCECPSGYSFFDAQYKYRGCKADFVPHSCDGKNHSTEFELRELPHTTWVNSKYQQYSSITVDRCGDLCLGDCFCAAAVFDGKSCAKMTVLTAGWQTNDTNTMTLIKVRTSDPRGHATLRSMLPYIVIGCLAFLLMLATGFLLVHYCYLSKRAKRSLLSSRVFTYKELKQATNGFNELLGEGGFGKVYKGKVNSPQSDVAVKKLNHSDDYKVEFTNEVQSIGQIHHRNLVRMIGYCKEGRHRILVFEFMSGGSLGDSMKRPGRPLWSWLAEAAQAIARGLEYLHDGCTIPIIHCDIKPDNILLDHNLAPRITDFGISKLLKDQKLEYTITKIIGTKGYLAPEWFHGRGRVDNKVDVYSFGVVLLEMIYWKKTSEAHPPDDQNAGTAAMLKDWAENLIRNGRTELLVQGESEALQDMESVERFARVAIWCVQTDPSTRPTMRKVVQMLQGTVEVDPLPDPPRPPGFSAILSIGNGTNDSHGTIDALQIE